MLRVVRDDTDRLRDGLERRWGHWTGADEVGEEAHDGLLLWLLLIRVVNLGLRRVRRANVYTRLKRRTYRFDIRSESSLYTCSGCVQVARPPYEPSTTDADTR